MQPQEARAPNGPPVTRPRPAAAICSALVATVTTLTTCPEPLMFVVVSLVICLFEVGGVCEVLSGDGSAQSNRPAFPFRVLYCFQPIGIKVPK